MPANTRCLASRQGSGSKDGITLRGGLAVFPRRKTGAWNNCPSGNSGKEDKSKYRAVIHGLSTILTDYYNIFTGGARWPGAGPVA